MGFVETPGVRIELKLSFEHAAKVAGASCAALVTC